jgi:hypothetical protein
MPFDPDAYLKKKPEQTTNPFKAEGFDPDAYLKQTPKPFDPDAYLGAKPAAPTQPSAPPEESGFLRQAADIPIGITKGMVTGVRMIADAFGAGSDTSKLIKTYEDQIGGLLSAQAKNDQKEISRILKDAQDKGVLDQLAAAGKAFATAPIDLTVQALGTSAPALITGLATTIGGAPTAVALGTSALMGSVMGAGEAKGSIYEATKEELLNIKVPKAKAEQIAIAAQEYGGKNLDQILLAAGLGAATSATGFEASAIKGMTTRILSKAAVKETAGAAAKEVAEKGVARSIATGIGKESIPELLQGSQIQLAENLALQREGFDVPTMRGVVSQGALEALSGAPLGAYAGYRERGAPTVGEDTREGKALSELDKLAAEEEKVARSFVERKLYAELGRPPLEEEILEGIDDYLDEQNAGRGVEPGAGIAGVSDISEPEATGVPDTTVATTPESEGLDTTGGATTVAGAGTGAQLGALEQQIKDLTRQRDRLEAAIEDTQYEGDYAGMQELQQQVAQYDTQIADLTQQLRTGRVEPTIEELESLATKEEAEYAARQETQEKRKANIREVVKANVDSAIDQAGEYKDADEAADAYRGNVFDTLQEQGIELDDYEYNYANQQFDKVLEEARQAAQPKQTEVVKEEKPTTDFAALEAAERARHDEVRRIDEEKLALLTKAGRKPAKNSPARKKYDELEKQRVQAHWNWVESEQRLNTAKRAAEKGVPLQFVDPTAIALERAQQLYDASPEYSEDQFDAAYTALQKELKATNTVRRDEIDRAVEAFSNRLSELENQRKGAAPNIKPTFALPENYVHGTDYLTAQKIIQQGRLIPDAGKRMYSYSQFGRKAVYLTDRNGWWLDADKAASGRAAVYDASVPFKIDPKANIREVNTKAELDAIAREIGEKDSGEMMRKLSVENLDYEQAARGVKNLSFEEFVKNAVKNQRELLQRYEVPGADTVKDIASWAAQDARERPEFSSSEEDILDSLRDQYDFLQNYEEQYKDADEVTQKLLDAGIDGVYIGPNFGSVDPEEYKAFDALWDRMQDAMPEASPEEVFAAAKEEYKKINPTYFDRASDVVASDQLALFRPELAVVDRARLAATRPAPSQKPALSVEEFKKKPGETEDDYVDRVSRGVGAEMPTNIVEMLRNNDLNDALRAIANTLPGFYGTLANRLAALDMPTGVRIGDQRNLARRRIDYVSGDQQKRLFNYLRTAAPDFFNKYFNQYDRAENLELVYEGLTKLPNFVSDTKLGPVRTEYDTVLQTFEDDMPGLTALGGYYPTFDEINLNDTSRAYSTGWRRESGLSYRTFLHESVHAATEMLLLTPKDQRTTEQNAAIDELNRLYEYAISKIKADRYGFTNLSEFIAEVMTSQKFQNELKAIPYPPTKSNIFTRFVQAVLKLVGLDNVAGRAMVEAEKLFTPARPFQTISAGPRFAQAPKKRRVRGPISTPDTYRTAESQQNALKQTIKDAYEGRMPWADAVKIIGPSIWDSGNTILRKTALPVMNLTQLEDLTRTKFTQITGALKIIRDMVASRAKKMNTASEIMRDWTKAQKKNFAQSQLMGRIMMEATIRGIDPDTAPAGALNKPLQDAWNTLDNDFKIIYRRVRDFYANSVNEMVKEMERRASANPDPVARAKALKKIKEQFGPDKLIKPYFPLRRFGQYFYQVGEKNFKEFYEFEDPFTRDAAMRKRIKDLSAGNEQQRKLAASIQKGNGISELYGKNISTTQALKDVQDLIDNITATDTADLKEQLKDSLNQLIYILLPQQSVRKMFINRKSIQGASADMLRVFATTAVHSAYQQSRFMYSEKFLQNLNNARDEIINAQKMGMLSIDDAAMYKDFILEVEQRVPTIMSNEDTSMTAQVAGKASELTFYYMLSAPFTAMLNTIGAVQLAMPYIGGSYGYARANALLVKNMGRYLATSPTRTFSPLTKRDFAQVNFPSIAEGRKLPPLLQKAADRFIDDGVIDISLTNDIFELGERPSALYTGTSATIKKIMSGLFHQSERMNREIVLLTTFELAYDKFLNDYQRQPGMEGLRGVYLRDARGDKIKNTPDQAFELAIEEATRVTSTSLGDYSRQTKGRIFANPIMNLLLKFKQYPILAMYSIMRNFHVGIVAPFKKAEIDQYRALLEQELKNDPNKDKVIAQRLQEVEAQRKALEKEGRRRLAGILGVTTILGGVAASPFFSLVVGNLVKMFADDDDDEYFDWENWFYNYMEGEFGGYLGGMLANAGIEPKTAEKAGRKTAEAVSRGLPAAMGAAVADRVSLDPKALLWRDGRYSPDARENFIESLIANAGPVVGLALNFVDAYQLAKEGQYARAVEKAVPAIIAKPASAVRMAEEGATTKKGDVLIDDFTVTELAMQSIGLQPERLAQKQKAAIAIKQKEQKILDAREAIMDRLWMERDNPDGYEAAMERALEFNSKRKDPKMLITPKKIRESFKKRAQLKAEAETLGAKYDKRLRSELMDMGEFADDE